MKTTVSFAIFLTLIAVGSAFGATAQTSFDFMLIGSGSRAVSMGEAFTAVSGDVGAAFFNPACIGVLTRNELSFSHISYIGDATSENFSFVARNGKLRFGGSLNLGRVPDIERRGQTPSGTPLGTFDEHNFVAAFSWGMPVSGKFTIGNSLKFAYEKLDIEDATAFAVDLGGYYGVNPNIAAGASIRNLGTRPKFISVAFDLPRELRAGVSYRSGVEYPVFIASADLIKPTWGDQKIRLNIGAEYNYQDLAFLRGGYNLGYESKSMALGGGIAYRNFVFDYAFVPLDNGLGNTHRVTFRIRP